MIEYIFLMHNDGPASEQENWEGYIRKLIATGNFRGGSAIGGGTAMSKSAEGKPITEHITGYIKITAESLEQARTLVDGNPVYEAGGTVEIRELLQTQ